MVSLLRTEFTLKLNTALGTFSIKEGISENMSEIQSTHLVHIYLHYV